MWRDLSVYSVDIVKCCYCRDSYLLIVVFDVFLNSCEGLFSVFICVVIIHRKNLSLFF